MRDTVKQMVDTALKASGGTMPIVLRFGPVDLIDAAAYLKGKHGCKLITLESKSEEPVVERLPVSSAEGSAS